MIKSNIDYINIILNDYIKHIVLNLRISKINEPGTYENIISDKKL